MSKEYYKTNHHQLRADWAKSSEVQSMPLTKITLGMQMRAYGTDKAHIADCMQAIESGDELTPVDVFLLDGKYLLVDGYHRFFAYQELQKREIKARVFHGRTREDAKIYGAFANVKHGKRATGEDVTKAIQELLHTKEFQKEFMAKHTLRTKKLAAWIGVAESTVYNATTELRHRLKSKRNEQIREKELEGLSKREIGKVLDISPTTVGSVLTDQKLQIREIEHKENREDKLSTGAQDNVVSITDFRKQVDEAAALISDEKFKVSEPDQTLKMLSIFNTFTGLSIHEEINYKEIVKYATKQKAGEATNHIHNLVTAIGFLQGLADTFKEQGHQLPPIPKFNA